MDLRVGIPEEAFPMGIEEVGLDELNLDGAADGPLEGQYVGLRASGCEGLDDGMREEAAEGTRTADLTSGELVDMEVGVCVGKRDDGFAVGSRVGFRTGASEVGEIVGLTVGIRCAKAVVFRLGTAVGICVGFQVERVDGTVVGAREDGLEVGVRLGLVEVDGMIVGVLVGLRTGHFAGLAVG